MFRQIAAVVVLSLILLSTASAQDRAGSGYTELTDAEVESYLQSITYDQLLQEIRKLDAIEHLVPWIDLPTMVAVVTDHDVGISYVDGAKATIGIGRYLSYSFDLPLRKFEDVVPAINYGNIVVSVAVGFVIDAITVYLARGLDLWSIPIGAGAGGLSAFLLFIALDNR